MTVAAKIFGDFSGSTHNIIALYFLQQSMDVLDGYTAITKRAIETIQRDFHPLVFFYDFALGLLPTGFPSGLYLVYDKLLRTGAAVTGPRSVFVAP